MKEESLAILKNHIPEEELEKILAFQTEKPEKVREIKFQQPETAVVGDNVPLSWEISTILDEYETEIVFYHMKKIKCRVRTKIQNGYKGTTEFKSNIQFKCVGEHACTVWMYFNDMASGAPTNKLTTATK
jgi:hypothetical protein